MFKSSPLKSPFLMRCVGVFLPLLMSVFAQAQVSGIVFRDFNANGVKDNTATFNETFVQGVTVTAYNSAGTAVGSAVTNASGAYSFTGLTLPLRIEFTGFQTGDYTAPAGAGNASSVQFYTAASSAANFAVNYPADYIGDTDPYIVAPQFINGTYNNPTSSGFAGLYSFPSSSTGNPTGGLNLWGTDNPANHQATIGQMGANWGVAYQRTTKTVFTSAVLRRFCGFGPLGPGGIYKTNMSNPATTSGASNFVDVTTIGIPVGADMRTASGCNAIASAALSPANDIAAADLVGRMGIGGIEYDEPRNTLWLVNMANKKLYGINSINPAVTPTAANVVGGYTISLPAAYPLVGGELRPWGLKVYRGKIYVGAVADGSTTSSNVYDLTNLKGYVLEFDPNSPASGFSVVHEFSFNYPHAGYGPYSGSDSWVCWESPATAGTYWGNQPIISDIEFDTDGSIILGILDRGGLQNGSENYGEVTCNTNLNSLGAQGDILRICKTAGGYVFSGNTGCSNTIPTGLLMDIDGDPAAPNNYIKEYYWGDHGPISGDNSGFNEAALGGLALLPGNQRVLTVAMDIENWHSGGVLTLDNTTGGDVQRYNLYHSDPSTGSTFMAKAVGLGDIEVISAPPALEIGNRVWSDDNKNGIQDAGEAGIGSIPINIYKAGVQVGTTTTAANGTWYFNTTNVTMNGATGLLPNTAYTIRIAAASIPSGKTVTSANVGGAGQPDVRDSDASLVSGNIEIAYTTGTVGANDHSLDIGLITPTPICAGEEYTLTVASGTTGEWYKDGVATGNTTTTYIVTTAGTYRFQSTSGGCTMTTCADAVFSAGPCATVGNYVWIDANSNGINDEPATSGINGITVELWKETTPGSGTFALLRTTSTANNGSNPGYYLFSVGEAANYKVKFPTTYGTRNLTTQTVAAGTDNNSDANISTGFSPVFAINPAGSGVIKDNLTIDAGFICPGGCVPVTVVKN